MTDVPKDPTPPQFPAAAPGPRAGDPRPSLSSYYNAARLRSDMWNRLKGVCRRGLETDQPTASFHEAATAILDELSRLEVYYAFPGPRAMRELRLLLARDDWPRLAARTARILRLLTNYGGPLVREQVESRFDHDSRDGAFESGAHRRADARLLESDSEPAGEARADSRPSFEVLIVDRLTPSEELEVREQLLAHRRQEDEFLYDVVFVPSFEDALIAVLLNAQLQSVIIRYDFPFRSDRRLDFTRRFLNGISEEQLQGLDAARVGLILGRTLHSIRPGLDLYLVTDAPVEVLAGNLEHRFRRVFFRQEDYRELHQSLLKGIRARYRTPFFSALRTYSQKPTGVFHALPISRGKSIAKSRWIRDMEQFYGPNVFVAETSATTGGLDSLLQPHGSIKEAQELAARAFGALKTVFVTNGTSTANKIVLQALVRPGDIVLASRDCHMSHHYAFMLAGAMPIYMDPYPLPQFSIYGGVPIREIKRRLLELKAAGKLDRVRLVLLTNCSFDGIVYHPQRVMEEALAIKPDLIFVWDEAWFAFGRFNPITRRRTAMEAARLLRDARSNPDPERPWQASQQALRELAPDDPALLDMRLQPDPAAMRVRVYATQSTHKTLTSLRQGSMIHIFDQDFERLVRESFHQAYLTHTSTSANYQILASLDVGRRQVELEGYELVQQQSELAITLRERINMHPLLSRHLRMLTPEDLIPEPYRASGFRGYRDLKTNWTKLDRAWEEDEFCLEPSRLTLAIGLLGVDGDSFKRRLIEDFDIQVNKTSRNTVLFLTHIGTTRGAIAYLIDVLAQLCAEQDARLEDERPLDRELRERAIETLTVKLPPLPDFSAFHEAFRPDPAGAEGDLRAAFFAAGLESAVTFLRLDGSIQTALDEGRAVVSAGFVTPYPPGFPILVPGQVVSREILAFLRALDVKEIHGYEPQHGLRVFTEAALEEASRKARASS